MVSERHILITPSDHKWTAVFHSVDKIKHVGNRSPWPQLQTRPGKRDLNDKREDMKGVKLITDPCASIYKQ
jgi:hypothetical protein